MKLFYIFTVKWLKKNINLHKQTNKKIQEESLFYQVQMMGKNYYFALKLRLIQAFVFYCPIAQTLFSTFNDYLLLNND